MKCELKPLMRGSLYECLKQDAREGLRKVGFLTKKGVRFQADVTLEVPAVVSPARSGDAFHLLQYHPDYEKDLDYIVLHECGHLLRFFSVPKGERLCPAIDDDCRRRALLLLRRELEWLATKGLSSSLLERAFLLWHQGLVMQVASLPADIRIERWLHQSYPSVRKPQVRFLSQQVEVYHRVSSDAFKRVTPRRVFLASSALNAVFCRLVGGFVEDLLFEAPLAWRLGRLVDGLAERFRSEENETHKGDVRIATAWADILGIGDWFYWQELEATLDQR